MTWANFGGRRPIKPWRLLVDGALVLIALGLAATLYCPAFVFWAQAVRLRAQYYSCVGLIWLGLILGAVVLAGAGFYLHKRRYVPALFALLFTVPPAGFLVCVQSLPMSAFGVWQSCPDNGFQLQFALCLTAQCGATLTSGPGTYATSALILPPGVSWLGEGTVLRLVGGSNLPVARNASESLHAVDDTGITLRRLVFDANGHAQSGQFGRDGVVQSALRFAGVGGLRLDDVTARDSIGYGMLFANCRRVTGAVTVVVDRGIAGTNKDGVHLLGRNQCFKFTSVRVVTSQDDAFALNADDVEHGGRYSAAAIAGPIANIEVGELILDDCFLGVRLLSATAPITGVRFREIRGSVRDNALHVDDYGLGFRSCYESIIFDKIEIEQGEFPDQHPLVEVVVGHPARHCDFRFGRIIQSSRGLTPERRPAIKIRAHGTSVELGEVSGAGGRIALAQWDPVMPLTGPQHPPRPEQHH